MCFMFVLVFGVVYGVGVCSKSVLLYVFFYVWVMFVVM